MPLISTLANASARGYGMFGGAAGEINSYESIATVTVGAGGQSTISFTSIPSTYKHLQIRMMLRGDRADTGDDIKVQFNSDTGNNYANHILSGNGASVGTYSQSSFSMIYSYEGMTAANAASSIFYVGVMDILDYSSTVKNKTTRWLQGKDLNGSGAFAFTSGLWASTSAINSVLVAPRYGSNFVQYSQIALYGIKG